MEEQRQKRVMRWRAPSFIWATAAIICCLPAAAGAANDSPRLAWPSSYAGTRLQFQVAPAATALEANRSGSPYATPEGDLALTLPGELYGQPMPLKPVTKATASSASPLSAAAAFLSAQLADDVDWIVASFPAGEQSALTELFGDPAIRQANYDAMTRTHDHEIIGWTAIDGKVVLLLRFNGWSPEGHATQQAEPFALDGGQWKRTNALAKDLRFDIVAAAFDHGTVGPAPPAPAPQSR